MQEDDESTTSSQSTSSIGRSGVDSKYIRQLEARLAVAEGKNKTKIPKKDDC